MEFLRDRETSLQSQSKSNFLGKALPHAKTMDAPPPRTSPKNEPTFPDDEPNIESNVEFLRQMEDQDSSRGHKSRSSISSNKPKRADRKSVV